MPADLLEEAQCNVNFACVDQLSPILAEGFVWSWDKGANERGTTDQRFYAFALALADPHLLLQINPSCAAAVRPCSPTAGGPPSIAKRPRCARPAGTQPPALSCSGASHGLLYGAHTHSPHALTARTQRQRDGLGDCPRVVSHGLRLCGAAQRLRELAARRRASSRQHAVLLCLAQPRRLIRRRHGTTTIFLTSPPNDLSCWLVILQPPCNQLTATCYNKIKNCWV
jgi:hypothetical protein